MATSTDAEDQALLDRITKLEATNAELRGLVTELKTELDATEKRLDEIEKSQGGAGGAAGGDEPKLSKKEQKKKDKKAKGKGREPPPGGWPKKAPKPAGKKLTKPQKAAEKEGGKKGQDLAGMCDLGGMIYFTVNMEQCAGDWDLLALAMEGANKVPDPDGDDRKGGAADLIKCFMDIDDKAGQVIMLISGKTAVAAEKGLPIKEWITHFLNDTQVRGEIIDESIVDGVETYKAVAKKNEEFELFPLKQRDAAMNVSFQFLKSKSLVASDSSGSEVDMGDLGDAAGFDW